MKRTVKVKNLIAFAAVLILLFSIIAVPASAAFPPLDTAGRRLGAFLLAAIQAINITLTSTAAQSTGAEIINYLSDPLDVQYSYQEMWTDQPKIQIWDDYVTIDGVEYTDIWLSNEAATKFQVDAYDFKSAYNIASHSNGTFADGMGTVDGVPVFNDGQKILSQSYTVPFEVGTYSIGNTSVEERVRIQDRANYIKWLKSSGSNILGETSFTSGDFPLSFRFLKSGNYFEGQTKVNGATAWTSRGSYNVNDPLVDLTSFDFDWVSGEIPAQRVLDPDEGMMLRVPSDRVPGLKDFIDDYPEFTEPGGAPIDVNLDPDIMNKLDDLIDIIAPIIPIINNIGDVSFTVNHAEPTPPILDTPIVDATVPQVVNPIINEITNYGDQITQQIPNIIENIPTIDSICENIDTAPYHDLDTGLDRLPNFFLPFITELRSALGIWHYVTEWLAQINTTFAFVSGCLAGTSIMTPIYAAIAGFMCIKVYRRMTA